MGTFSGLLATLDPDTRIRGRQFEHFVNTDAVFDLAHEIASAQTPSELMAIWSSYVKHRFEMMAKQAKEFTEVDRK
jgi:hypothetical protein